MELEKLLIVRHLMRLGAYLEREGTRILAKEGLTHQQYTVLTRISEHGPLSQKDVCLALLYEKSNVSKIVKKLSGSGFIEIAASEADKRAHVIRATEEGKAVIRRAQVLLGEWVTNWLKLVNDDETRKLLENLGWLNALSK